MFRSARRNDPLVRIVSSILTTLALVTVAVTGEALSRLW